MSTRRTTNHIGKRNACTVLGMPLASFGADE
jgi:hypothetical protein